MNWWILVPSCMVLYLIVSFATYKVAAFESKPLLYSQIAVWGVIAAVLSMVGIVYGLGALP